MSASPLTKAMTEADLQRAIIDAAKLYGWRVAHFRSARTEKGWRTPVEGDAGFPDLVLARGGKVLFMECKSEKGRQTQEQAEWEDAIAYPRMSPDRNYFLVKPADLDFVLEELR